MQDIDVPIDTADKFDTETIHHQNTLIKVYEIGGPEACKSINRDVAGETMS